MEKKSLGADAAAVETAGSIASDAATARHTPGPWRAVVRALGDYEIVADSVRCEIVTVFANDVMDEPTWFPARENAHLIAAAPELLALAYQYLNDMRHGVTGSSIDRRIELIQTVIAKAEGRS